MGFVKADWAHTKAVELLRKTSVYDLQYPNVSAEMIADALRDADDKGYRRGFSEGLVRGEARVYNNMSDR